MVKIDYAIQTSERTRDRLTLCENWTRHVQKPSTVRFISDEQVGRGDYLSAIDKTIFAIDTFQVRYDWLYIVDDDGYVVPRRLELRLIDLDPDEHHAIGCVQGVLSNETHKFPALHGGCGYALSRATALALQQRHWHGELVAPPQQRCDGCDQSAPHARNTGERLPIYMQCASGRCDRDIHRVSQSETRRLRTTQQRTTEHS